MCIRDSLGSSLHGGADFLVAGFLVQLNGQIDHRYVGSRNAECHTREFLVQLGDNNTDSLGSTSRGRDDVLEDATAAAPILVGRTVNGLLGGGGSMHGGHQAALDAPCVVQDLSLIHI